MSPRTLALLAAATVAALLLAWLLQRGPAPEVPGQPLLPTLAAQLDTVSALVVEPAGGTAFRLERAPDGWRAPAKGGYPVDVTKLRRLLLRLAEATVAETKTANPELHDRLGVDEQDGEPGSGVRLRLEGAEVSAVIIGQRETRGVRGTYVRLADDHSALLVDQDLQPERELIGWLDREVLDIPPERIASLEIARPDGETLRIDRDELDIFRIADLPEGYRPSGPTAAEAVVRALSALRLDDVRPRGADEPEGTPVRATFRLREGIEIQAHSWETHGPAEGTAYWAAFSARPAADADAPAQAAEEARALNERLGAWLYRLPAWKQEQLVRRQRELLLPLED